jgi:HEAT repeat protein
VEALTSGPDGTREAVARMLRDVSADPRVAAALVAALDDPNPAVRASAIEGIASPHNRWVDPESAEFQKRFTWSSNDFREDPVAARVLLPLLDDPSEVVRSAAWIGLREVGGPDDDALLARAARFGCQVHAGEQGREIAGHLRLLARGAGKDKAVQDVWRVARVLARLGAVGIAALHAVLGDAAQYPDHSRVWAIDALGASGDAHAVHPLVETLRGALPPDPSILADFDIPPDERAAVHFEAEQRAAHALVRLGDAGVAALESVSRDDDISPKTRRAAADALKAFRAADGQGSTGSEPS